MDPTDIVRAESIANEDIMSRGREVMAEAMVHIDALRVSIAAFNKIRSRFDWREESQEIQRHRLLATSHEQADENWLH